MSNAVCADIVTREHSYAHMNAHRAAITFARKYATSFSKSDLEYKYLYTIQYKVEYPFLYKKFKYEFNKSIRLIHNNMACGKDCMFIPDVAVSWKTNPLAKTHTHPGQPHV